MKRPYSNSAQLYLCLVSLALMGAGCNASDPGANGQPQGQDNVSSPPAVIPPGTVPVGGVPISAPISSPVSTAVGPTCKSDSTHYCVALKYTVYDDSKGVPVVSQADAIANLATINQVWGQCNIAFQIDTFDPEDPNKSGLTFNTANDSELDSIRKAYENNTTFLVVTTGTWNRSGTLGNTGANAWTNMPGGSVFGAILEAPVGTYPNIIAHELGHYLNLDHVSDVSNIMNPIIYSTSNKLSSSQCSTATSAIDYFWQSMKR